MTDEEQARKIEVSIDELELTLMLEALSEFSLTRLAVKVNTAWLKGAEAKSSDTQLAEGLQTIRGMLFRLKGYLELAGYPVAALTWVEEALEALTSLQTMEVNDDR